MRVHRDERRTAYCDLFPYLPGDVNLFIVKPGQRTCWHRHQKQTDRFRVIRGAMQFQYWKEGGYTWTHLLDAPEQELTVIPGFWHGYENIGDEDAYLLMYLDQHWNPDDEERLSEAEHPWLVV